MYLRPRTVGRLPCVKGAVGRRLTEGSAKAFLLNRVLSKHPALSIPPSRLRRATSLYAREASSGGGVPLIRHGLCPCHLPRGGRLPPAGDKTLSWERVDRAKPGTGVGWYEPGPGTAPLPALGGHLPPGEGWRDFLRKNFKIYVDILGIQW